MIIVADVHGELLLGAVHLLLFAAYLLLMFRR
jgi:hypothetical protein